MKAENFDNLTPDNIIYEVEAALKRPMGGLAAPLPSYINRVYELQTSDKERFIAKFYRPGRWTKKAIQEEHDFVLECAEADIPVIAPLTFPNGSTLQETADGIFFTLYPKRFGRSLEIISAEGWQRLGMVIARMHLVGGQSTAPERTLLLPKITTATEINHLLSGGFVSLSCHDAFKRTAMTLLDEIVGMFHNVECIRIHGDCHCGNILDRPDEGLMIIDFDDMMTGPPVQDLWLLLPEHIQNSRREFALIVDGYSCIREFDCNTINLIEPLRAMRIIYFLDWCSRQIDDYKFRHNFPDWGSDSFWRREIADLQAQLNLIKELKYSSDQLYQEY